MIKFSNFWESIFQILLAAIGSAGFAIALNAKKTRILAGGIGGGISWGIYVLCEYLSLNEFASSLISAIFVYVYSAVLSRTQKAPINVFFAPTVIPLLPGGGLYYTIYALMENNRSEFYAFGKETLQISLGLVIGFVLSSVVWNFFASPPSPKQQKMPKS